MKLIPTPLSSYHGLYMPQLQELKQEVLRVGNALIIINHAGVDRFFSVKGQLGNIFGFVSHTVSAAVTQLCP